MSDSIAVQLASLGGNLNAAWVQRSGAWYSYAPGAPGNTLAQIYEGETVVLNMTAPATLVYGSLRVELPAGVSQVIWTTGVNASGARLGRMVYWDPLQGAWLELKTPGFAGVNPLVNVGWEFAWSVTWGNPDDAHPVRGRLECQVKRPDGSPANIARRTDLSLGNDWQDVTLPYHTGWIDPGTGLERVLYSVSLAWSFVPDLVGQYQLTATLTDIS